jgi:hypothetical protein
VSIVLYRHVGGECEEGCGPWERCQIITDKNMTNLLLIAPYVALCAGVAMMVHAIDLSSRNRPQTADGRRRKMALLILTALALPSLAQAASTDLRTSAEAGNAIIMYLSGILAAVGIVAAGVAMMMGRQSIAKWAFAGAVICGLAFAIVRTMWTNMGLEGANVGTFQ